MDSALLTLKLNGQRYGHWQGVELRESVDDLCASLRLSVTMPGSGNALPITANTVAEVLIGDTLVGVMRVDLLSRSVGADSHEIHLEARSLGRELVDTQYSQTLNGLSLGELTKRICATFAVPLKVDCETAVVPQFAMQCETPANALINAARAANCLLYPQADGGLILTKPTRASPVATLTYGLNILHYAVVDEFRLRYSDYVVKSFDYEGNRSLGSTVQDVGIRFFRPFHIVADKHGHGQGGCDRRATLEHNRRLARSSRIELAVQGWRFLNGQGSWQPWAVNTQVRVVIPQENIDGVYLIGELTRRLDAKGGSVTRLSVMPRAAFEGFEKKKQKRGAGTKPSRNNGGKAP